MKTEKQTTEFLEAVDTKVKELIAMFEENDCSKTLLLIASDDCSNGKTGLITGMRGLHDNLVQSISQLLYDDDFSNVIRDAAKLNMINNITLELQKQK